MLLPGKVEVYINEQLIAKIKYLCSKIPDREWSGVLSYRPSGQFGKTGFKCILQDILLMNIGDIFNVGYDFNYDVARHKLDNPHLRSSKIGLIHSHHIMDVFFSDDDQQEFHDRALMHNYYLSVIVNNDTDIIARIGFIADRKYHESESLSYTVYQGQEEVQQTTDLHVEEKVLGIYECDIVLYDDSINLDFVSRCAAIKERTGYSGSLKREPVVDTPAVKEPLVSKKRTPKSAATKSSAAKVSSSRTKKSNTVKKNKKK